MEPRESVIENPRRKKRILVPEQILRLVFAFFLTLNLFLSQTLNRMVKTRAAAGGSSDIAYTTRSSHLHFVATIESALKRESLESLDSLPAKRF